MRSIVLIIIAIVFVSACTTRKVEPTRESRKAIDSLFQVQLQAIQPQLDSICRVQKDSMYRVAFDSIMDIRLTEMNRLVK